MQAARAPDGFKKGATGNLKALLASDEYLSEIGLADSLARTVPSNKYAHFFHKTFSGDAPSGFYTTNVKKPETPKVVATLKQVLSPNQVLNAKKGGLLRKEKQGAWMPYARQRQQDNDNNLQGKLIKASSVAQVLSEVRAIEQDVYERNASTGRPYSAPKARAPRIPPLKILEQPEKNNYLPHTEANEEPDDYTYVPFYRTPRRTTKHNTAQHSTTQR
jgi:hypothetical protein